MRRLVFLMGLFLPWWQTGCVAPSSSSGPGGSGLAATMPGTGESAGPTQEVLLVQVRLMGIEVPVGSASSSEDIWSYVEEESARSTTSALGRNGFRVGIVRRDNWGSLERVLKQVAGRQAQDAILSVLPNNSLPIVLQQAQPAQTLWVFHPDKTLTGEDFPPCDELLTVVCAVNEDEPNQVVVIGQPQLRSRDETVQIAEGGGRLMLVTRPKIYELPDLTFRLSVPNHDIIVIGPGAAARRSSSVAYQFLTKERDGIRFETVLVLVPSVVRARTRTVPAPSAPPPPPPPTEPPS
jgi:hypothetical protein